MPTKINIYNQKAEKVGDIKLSDNVFGVKANEPLAHQAMVAQMSNKRQVLAHTKDRSEVRGGGRKPWRQKGTGRARAGSTRSPIWKGGGVTFGPRKDRNFTKNINKKMKQNAMLMVLSDRVKSRNFVVLDKLEVEGFKTSVFNKMIEGLEKNVLGMRKQKATASAGQAESRKQKIDKEKSDTKIKKEKRSVLVINDKKDNKVKYSGRNLAGVEIINLDNINILDLLKYRDLVLTVDGVKRLEERYGK
ncbi:MAG: 50S ribosomal protein L4 [Patescibacteria group bacterium]|nr:50S ribosomal protein L4 [Patescibacteria group bacterium]